VRDTITSTGACLAHYPGRKVYRDASNTIAAQFDFPGMDTCAHLEAEFLQFSSDRGGTPDGTRRPVERGQHPVSGSVYKFPAMIAHSSGGHPVVDVKQLLPTSVSERCELRRRRDEVRK
jgi:hypothetical protein